MLLIPCPWCGQRNEDEFMFGGESARVRPDDPASTTDAQWSDYLYNSTNHKGVVREWWWHVNGCTKWFVIDRDTVTHAIQPASEEIS